MVKRPLKLEQIKLIQVAVRAAGLRTAHQEGRYRLLLGQYKKSDGRPCQSCKDLNNWQVDDLLGICEGLGWRMPGKPEDFFRSKVKQAEHAGYASVGQIAAIRHLGGDLGWNDDNINGMIRRMTHATGLSDLTGSDGYVMIEAMKAMLSRRDGKNYETLADAAKAYS